MQRTIQKSAADIAYLSGILVLLDCFRRFQTLFESSWKNTGF
jgi:hypothetical protein